MQLKQQIKKCLSGALVGIFCLPFSAMATLNVLTSFPHDESLAKTIGGAFVSTSCLSAAHQDPHAIQPRPSLSVKLNRADLLITNGQDMELAWLPIALSNARNGKILEGQSGYFEPSQGVKLYAYTQAELQDTPFYALSLVTGMQKGSQGNVDIKRGNHHYWLDPGNGSIIAQNIADKLSSMDPEHRASYQKQAANFKTKMKKSIARWDAQMKPFAGTKVVSYHRDWTYLAKRHNLEIIGYVEPRETIPPGAADIAKLVKTMKDENVKIVIASPWQNLRISEQVARAAGAKVVVLPSSVGPTVNVKDYHNLFQVIYSRLIPALKAAQ
jgi:zinc/manganese transport system substrate-binding protein